jgi:hypothetical protein
MLGCLTQRYVERQDNTRRSAEISRLLNFRPPYFETLFEGRFWRAGVPTETEVLCS